MKKLIAVGIITILTFGLTGCNIEQPTIAESYTYENNKYGFALTFPATWGEVLAEEQQIDNRTNVIVTSEDGLKDISLHIFQKQSSPITAALGEVGETDNYVIGYQSKHLDIYNLEKEGKDASKEKVLQEELENIAATFIAL